MVFHFFLSQKTPKLILPPAGPPILPPAGPPCKKSKDFYFFVHSHPAGPPISPPAGPPGGEIQHFGIMLGPCWDHVGAMLGPCWDHVGIMLGSSQYSSIYFCRCSGSNAVHLRHPIYLATSCFLFGSQTKRISLVSQSISQSVKWNPNLYPLDCDPSSTPVDCNSTRLQSHSDPNR